MSQLPTVLVVDDDTDLLQLLTLRLQRAGFAVQTATGGAEALKRLADRQPQAVITDLRMDGINGLELLTEIESRYPVLPVVLMTAHGTIPDAVKATRRGAYAFLTKPIDDGDRLRARGRGRFLTEPDPLVRNPAETHAEFADPAVE